MTQIKYFLLNGELYSTNSNITLFDIIKYFNYKDSLLVLELNHTICSKDNWTSIFIADHDKIEIVTIVGGG